MTPLLFGILACVWVLIALEARRPFPSDDFDDLAQLQRQQAARDALRRATRTETP